MVGEREVALTSPTVGYERRQGRWMQWDPTRLVELAVAHEQKPFLEVDLRYLQAQGFGDAQPRAGQQANQSRVSPRPKLAR